jgi:hypothetical protein
MLTGAENSSDSSWPSISSWADFTVSVNDTSVNTPRKPNTGRPLQQAQWFSRFLVHLAALVGLGDPPLGQDDAAATLVAALDRMAHGWHKAEIERVKRL